MARLAVRIGSMADEPARVNRILHESTSVMA